ncbi:MAG: ATP-binding protein [Chloroflexota bacterium]|nr:ATP-binding protein [Chloroflexota bacterium]
MKPDITDPADPRFGRLVPCPGCGDAVRELRELRVMELLQERIARYTAFRGSLRECTLESFDTASDERAVAAYNAVIRFVQGEVPWAYLYGPPGNGKTHLAAAAVNRLIAQRRAVLFTTAPELLAMIRDGFDGGQAENLIGLCQHVAFGPAQDRPWLVVDDLMAACARWCPTVPAITASARAGRKWRKGVYLKL